MGENSDRGRILFHLSKHLYQTNHTLRQQLQGPGEYQTNHTLRQQLQGPGEYQTNHTLRQQLQGPGEYQTNHTLRHPGTGEQCQDV